MSRSEGSCCEEERMKGIENLIQEAEESLKGAFAKIDENEEARTRQILDIFRNEGVSYRHFAPTTGYGYDDIGRDTLERIYAAVFHTEAALMRPHVASGTAALSLTLFGMTRPGEKIISATGMPYDTLQGVIGIGEGLQPGSLKEMGVDFECVELKNGEIDVKAVEQAITPNTSLVIAQRSRGYAWRPSLFPEQFAELADMIHSRYPGIALMVDNCYGEFVCGDEPTDYGADLCVGSLIKNPGGGIAPTGGYVAGKKDMVERIAGRLTAPGLGRELGSYEASYRPFYQGLFMAPHTVAQARPHCWHQDCLRILVWNPLRLPQNAGRISFRLSKCSHRRDLSHSARGFRQQARWTVWQCRNPGICPAMRIRLLWRPELLWQAPA